jgi:hypothetical protein
MRKFLIGAAAIALAASGAIADPGGKGGGGGKGNDKAQAAQSHAGHGGGGKGGGQAGGQGQGKADKGPSMREAKADRGPPARQAKAERGPSSKAEKRNERAGEVRDVRRADREIRDVRRDDREIREVRRANRDVRLDRRDDDSRVVRRVSFDGGPGGIVEGCPPGLAKKNNGCLPPGLAKQRDADFRNAYYQPSWFGYDRLDDGRYFYDEGYLYRLGSNNSVLGYVPLLGGALSVGNPWPSYYDPAPVPEYYQDYYNLGAPDSYRYADDVLYRVDPQSGMINSIAALLTGDQFAVGQPMPTGYDVYNVPYAYQDEYYDTPEANYRYADGYVYEVDPTTQLVQAVIELLV